MITKLELIEYLKHTPENTNYNILYSSLYNGSNKEAVDEFIEVLSRGNLSLAALQPYLAKLYEDDKTISPDPLPPFSVDKLPNQNPLTFTGAVTGIYDGSEALTVEIPFSGSGSTVELDITLSEAGKAADAKAVGDALTELELKEETDPTVPEWAKAATKPSYTAEEVGARPADWMPTAAEVGALPVTYTPPDQTAEQVGADPVGTAAEAVSVHNTNNGSHTDIRLLIDGLTTRLNALANSTDEDLDQMAELVAYIKNNKSLIDGITTSKVSVSDIVNNLTTDISNKPLSAAQGVALKELIDALSNSMTAYRTAAAQDAIDSGKVDKVTGKGLSSNDYTAAAKAKVDAIPANPKYTDTVYDDTVLKERVATIEGKESAWDAKSDFSGSYNDLTDKPTIPTEVTPLIGTTNELTPAQVYNAVSAGIPVKVQYADSTYGLLSFTAFNIAESFTIIASQTIIYANGGYILAELIGSKSNGIWGAMFTTLAQKTDIPSSLKNPNALTIKIGSTTVTYDGSAAKTVTIDDGTEVSY